MADAAPDKERRKHGVMWYVGWALFLYVGSFVPFLVILARLHANGAIDMDSPTFVAVRTFYLPLHWLLEGLGLTDQFMTLLVRLILWTI